MDPKTHPHVSRRTVFVGAGVAGAVGAIAVATARSGAVPPAQPLAQAPLDAAEGYRLTDHVKQYYATARI